MPLDAYMFFQPSKCNGVTIEGESTDAQPGVPQGQKLKPFEIISFEWGAYIGAKETKTETETGSKTGTERGTSTSSQSVSHREVTVENFKIKKPFDSASPGLFMACTNPACVFDQAVILFRKSGGGEPFVYLKFIFKKVRVDSVEWGLENSDGGDKPDQEEVKCSFEECDIFYSPQTQKGEKALSFGGDQKKTASFKRSTQSSSE
jgi:type VI protein secretion system component Hcp